MRATDEPMPRPASWSSSGHVRRRPQHGREGAGGPRLVRRRQPAARRCCATSCAWSTRAAATSSRSRSWSTSAPARSSARSRQTSRQGATGRRTTLLFLEATDEVLVRRQEAARRPHPLQGDGRLLDGIQREREVLGDLRGDADLVIDTTNLNVHQLADKIAEAFGTRRRRPSCGPPCVASASSTASRSTPTSSPTCASCRTRTGCPSCGR